jgi:hypothetical protein
VLQRLLAELLAERESAAVEGHVEQCAACQDQLERLTASARCPMRRLSKAATRLAEAQLPKALLTRLLNACPRLETRASVTHAPVLERKSNRTSRRMRPAPLVDPTQLTQWRDPAQQAAVRRRRAPLYLALLWPIGAMLATLALLVLAQFIGLLRN